MTDTSPDSSGSPRSSGSSTAALYPLAPATEGLTSPIAAYLHELHDRYAGLDEGDVASYIPELADANRSDFGICLMTVDGTTYEAGDTRTEFTIQSISKAFTLATALEEVGEATVLEHIGVEPTGDAFNAITLAPGTGLPLNPMVNAGAITATGLVAGLHPDDATDHLMTQYGRFAGRTLALNDAVYRSETETGHRNRAIAHLLRGSGALEVEPDIALDLYFQQCSVCITAHDLASMAATLANGGVHPRTRTRVARRATVRKVLTIMATCGMYDGAGDWLYTVGLPAKSGVGGGIIAVLPGQLGLAVYSPPLDPHGNSVRGVRVCRDFSREMDLHLVQPGRHVVSPIRSVYTLAQVGSKRQRPQAVHERLSTLGSQVYVVELQGDFDFRAVEVVTRRVVNASPAPRFVVLDLRRVDEVHTAVARLLARTHAELVANGGGLIISNGQTHRSFITLIHEHAAELGTPQPVEHSELDLALEACENALARADALPLEDARVTLSDHELLCGLTDDQITRFSEHLVRRSYPAGTVVADHDRPGLELLLVLSGHLSVTLALRDGGTHRIATLAPGMLVGEMLLTANTPGAAIVAADTDVECAALSTDATAWLRTHDPELWSAILVNLLGVIARRAERIGAELAVLAE